MAEKILFVQFGLGPIGQKIVTFATERPNLLIDAAIDIDPAKVGKDVGVLTGGNPINVLVSNNAEEVLKNSPAKIVILSTVSSMANVEEQIMLCLRHKKNVVSSTEELAFPWIENPDVAKRIDQAAKEAGVTVLATGVNPGMVMDTLPITLTGLCRQVESVRIERHQDASIRRLPFQQKIGAGLSPVEFADKVAKKIIRHVGFTESVQMIANQLGWYLDRTEDCVEPVIAVKDVASPFLRVPKGQVAGVHQIARGFIRDKEVITLELQAYLGHPAPKDSVRITGEPSLYSEIKGGVNGDIATCAMVVNALPKVLHAAPGLMTMPEIATVSWFSGN